MNKEIIMIYVHFNEKYIIIGINTCTFEQVSIQVHTTLYTFPDGGQDYSKGH